MRCFNPAFDFSNDSSSAPVAIMIGYWISKSSRVLPRDSSAGSIFGTMTSFRYRSVQKGWAMRPSATSAAVFNISGPTAASRIGGRRRPSVAGVNSGVISE